MVTMSDWNMYEVICVRKQDYNISMCICWDVWFVYYISAWHASHNIYIWQFNIFVLVKVGDSFPVMASGELFYSPDQSDVGLECDNIWVFRSMKFRVSLSMDDTVIHSKWAFVLCMLKGQCSKLGGKSEQGANTVEHPSIRSCLMCASIMKLIPWWSHS
jgi:hypothetical protein